MKKLLLLLELSTAISCADKPECYNFPFYSQFNYQTNFNQTTPHGIKIDTSGQNILLELVDQATEETETCLTKNFGSPPHIPTEIMQTGNCITNEFNCPIGRHCFKVKIPNDWIWSCDGTQQLLPTAAPQELCDAKGFTYDPNCICRWRAGIQDQGIIVTTPNLYLYRDPLVRMITGCNKIWSVPELAECAKP